VTNDAATIIRELEVEHPAAKMMILGSQMQEQEVFDYPFFTLKGSFILADFPCELTDGCLVL